MTAMAFQLLGGIGLFLLGMVLLTDGLKALAGDALRRALMRFTGTPLKAFGSGALVTLMVQSSSATTVTLIGFVSAGLLSFPQAVGVVLGASLGTTGTGWLVALLGLKVSLGFYALPLVGIGALLRLVAHGRLRSLGLALAGFGLIFVGIETLQTGMQALAGRFDLAALPARGLGGQLAAVGIGAAMTIVMQSSSAAAATTLTALHSQAVNFEQAAALIIGAAIGTTVTGALAAIGGSTSARRTALAHILFNLATGLIAALLLPLFLTGIGLAQDRLGIEADAVALAAFHSAFIALGVLLFLPVLPGFARAIERLLPERGPRLTRHLDASLLQAPPVALEATRRALVETARALFLNLRSILADQVRSRDELLGAQVAQALDEIEHFFAKIPAASEDEPLLRLRAAQLHAIDHLMRLLARRQVPAVPEGILADPLIEEPMAHCRSALELAGAGLHGRGEPDWLSAVEGHALALADFRRDQRLAIMRQTAGGSRGPFDAMTALDLVRWLERVAYHTWRICHYLAEETAQDPAETITKPPADQRRAGPISSPPGQQG